MNSITTTNVNNSNSNDTHSNSISSNTTGRNFIVQIGFRRAIPLLFGILGGDGEVMSQIIAISRFVTTFTELNPE